MSVSHNFLISVDSQNIPQAEQTLRWERDIRDCLKELMAEQIVEAEILGGN